MSAVVAGQLASGMVAFAQDPPQTPFLVLESSFTGVRVYLVAAVIADSSIAMSLVILLWRRKSEYRFNKTNTMVNYIMLYVIGTGLITSIWCLVSVVRC